MERIRIQKTKNGNFLAINLFGPSLGYPVFGGQTMSQCLYAAQYDLNPCFSLTFLSANFFRPAIVSQPMEYRVISVHEGKSVISKRTEGYQNGKLVIVVKSCFMTNDSRNVEFQTVESKLYETEYVDFKEWIDSLLLKSTENALLKKFSNCYSFLSEMHDHFKIRVGNALNYRRQILFEFKNTPENLNEFNCLITFFSDIFLLETSLLILKDQNIQGELKLITTAQHTLHMFCKPESYNQEFIYLVECERLYNGLALCNGYVFDSKKVHLLTASQEVVIRMD